MTHQFTVRVWIRGDEAAAHQALEAALDAGVLQEFINDYDHAAGPVEVRAAVILYPTADGRLVTVPE